MVAHLLPRCWGQVLKFERLPAPTPLHCGAALPPLPTAPLGSSFPAMAALSRLEVRHLLRKHSRFDWFCTS